MAGMAPMALARPAGRERRGKMAMADDSSTAVCDLPDADAVSRLTQGRA